MRWLEPLPTIPCAARRPLCRARAGPTLAPPARLPCPRSDRRVQEPHGDGDGPEAEGREGGADAVARLQVGGLFHRNARLAVGAFSLEEEEGARALRGATRAEAPQRAAGCAPPASRLPLDVSARAAWRRPLSGEEGLARGCRLHRRAPPCASLASPPLPLLAPRADEG